MKNKCRKIFLTGCMLTASFVVWTLLVMKVDVQPVGVNGTNVGFAGINTAFHNLTGVNMTMYTVTDWLGLVPFMVCALFAVKGFIQLVKRKSLFKVDRDIVILGIYYAAVICVYVFFEIFTVNYRPVLIAGTMEASYPSSTTLLVMAVMPTLVFQADYRLKKDKLKKMVRFVTISFSAFMVVCRLVCGVHWITDIAGGLLISSGMYCVYKSVALTYTT